MVTERALAEQLGCTWRYLVPFVRELESAGQLRRWARPGRKQADRFTIVEDERYNAHGSGHGYVPIVADELDDWCRQREVKLLDRLTILQGLALAKPDGYLAETQAAAAGLLGLSRRQACRLFGPENPTKGAIARDERGRVFVVIYGQMTYQRRGPTRENATLASQNAQSAVEGVPGPTRENATLASQNAQSAVEGVPGPTRENATLRGSRTRENATLVHLNATLASQNAPPFFLKDLNLPSFGDPTADPAQGGRKEELDAQEAKVAKLLTTVRARTSAISKKPERAYGEPQARLRKLANKHPEVLDAVQAKADTMPYEANIVGNLNKLVDWALDQVGDEERRKADQLRSDEAFGRNRAAVSGYSEEDLQAALADYGPERSEVVLASYRAARARMAPPDDPADRTQPCTDGEKAAGEEDQASGSADISSARRTLQLSGRRS